MESHKTIRQEQGGMSETTVRARLLAVIWMCAVLALPAGYLMRYYIAPGHVQAAVMPARMQMRNVSQERLSLALSYIQIDRPQLALPLLQSVVEMDPFNAVAWNDLGAVHTMLKQYDEGITDCQRALKIKPDFQLAHNNLKWAEDEQRKMQLGRAGQQQAAPTAHNRAYYIAEGMALLHAQKYDQAIEAWREALQLDAKDAVAANNIGVAYMSKHQPAIALGWFQKALTFDPAMELAKNNMVWAQSELRQGSGAAAPSPSPAESSWPQR